MSATQAETEAAELLLVPRKRWTRQECYWLVEAGKLQEGRYELLRGEIVLKMPQGRLHIYIVAQLLEILFHIFGAQRVQSQSTLVIDDENEPEPDIAVLAGTVREYLDKEPGPQDVILIVEVSVSTLRADRAVKARLYSQAGIQEYWIVVGQERVVEIYRQPGPNGYASVITAGEGETVSPLAAPDAKIDVGALFP